jgi:hypothetical protein
MNMKQLSGEAFARARQFLKTLARPLERMLFEHLFEAASADRATVELARFQNEDGGFGCALEPDLRTPSSSALATGIGLRMLRDLGCSAAHPMVCQAVQYLLATFDHQTHVWRVAPRGANDFPHAGWWHDEDGSLARTFDGFVVIPRAELVGLLHHYSDLAPADWLQEVTERTVADIEVLETLGSGGGDTLVNALSLAETKELPQHFRDRLTRRIRAVVPSAVSRDSQEWDSYCITPLKVAPSPQSVVADLLWDALQAHLDYLVDHQTPEGTWDPVWSWGDTYPEAWEQAKREWRGSLTLDNLVMLRAFGRIEE